MPLFTYSLFTLLHWKSDTILQHRVNGPCFIFSLDNSNECICPWLSLRRFNITLSPSLFRIGRWQIYIYVFNDNLLFIWGWFWAEYNNVVLYYLLSFRRSFTDRLTLNIIPRIADQMHSCVTSGMNSDRIFHVISFLCANKYVFSKRIAWRVCHCWN